ncbi:efflux RND transporter periplasmic adaptor subunit [Marivita geojedonensis]|uniref:RND transporter n=1 Tax=Marivita geojedonensis TaxID=1123756 RepID=A0A1X4NB57_9RHOB|nr:HlyD family efflux transporter periplasmic adaptor subunit [Marivita geojedonensis]OSQ43795.1 RND transporter [Marivita geojedonensis]PRY72477.1 HlyD family secretion protein [Marivita geojedonensis]
MHRRTRLVLILCLAAAIVGGLLWTALRPVPVLVEIAQASRGPMQVTLEVDGTTRIREIFEVAAPIAGTAKRSPVRVGDPVIAGETVVAVVEPIAPSLLDARSRQQAEAAVHEAQAALAVADSRLSQAEEELAYAQSQFDRAQELVERGVASLVRLEDAAQILNVRKSARDAAQSARAMAESTLERTEAALIMPDVTSDGNSDCCITLTAPTNGAVLSVERISERPVSAGETLLSIGDPTDLEIVAEPLSRDAVQIPDAARAIVDRWGGPDPLEARLRRIDPSARTDVSALGIEEQRVEAVFDIVSPPEDRAGLGNGYSVRLSVVMWETDDALQVPLGALFRVGSDWALFTIKDGTATEKTVEAGARNDRTVQILSGLAEGDQIIVHPGEAVADGVPVTAITAD